MGLARHRHACQRAAVSLDVIDAVSTHIRFMQQLNIYNTLAREKQPFVPIEPGKVRMYVCGMTVYDYCHVGHARVMVVFDMVHRWLRAAGTT
jgi:cysteinyl-tRNA synthetase